VVGLQNAAVPNSAVPMHDAPEMYVAHWPLATLASHDATLVGGHCEQLCVSQSSMHPVSWSQALETYGLTQLKMP